MRELLFAAILVSLPIAVYFFRRRVLTVQRRGRSTRGHGGAYADGGGGASFVDQAGSSPGEGLAGGGGSFGGGGASGGWGGDAGSFGDAGGDSGGDGGGSGGSD